MDYFDAACAVVDRPIATLGKSVRFWRQEPPILERGKIVRGGLFPHQKVWWDLPNFIKVFVGGYGAGKTVVGCKRIIADALTNAPCMVAAVSPTFPLARKTTIPTIISLLSGKQTRFGRHAFWWKYNKTSHEFHIRFRGREAIILILSGEDPTALRGPNIASGYIDEPFIQDEEVFRQMMARIRHPDARVKHLLLTGTPEGISSWGYDLCKGDLFKENDVGMVQASSRLNLAIGPDYVKRLEGVFTSKSALSYIEGEFVALTEGLVYYGFNPMNSLAGGNVEKREMPHGAEWGCGMDFNVNPMAAAVFWRDGNHMHYVKEYELPNADTEFMCETLKENHKGLETIYPDASGSARKTSAPAGKTDFHYIREAGFTISANWDNPKRRDRYNSVNGKLAPKVGSPTITIDPVGCPHLIKYLSTYNYEEINKQEAMSHLLDGFSYPVSYLYPVNRDTVQVGRMSGT